MRMQNSWLLHHGIQNGPIIDSANLLPIAPFVAHISVNIYNQGAISIRKTVLPGMVIPMLKIRRPNDRLIFNMEIAIRR